jgi:hypothetical protein
VVRDGVGDALLEKEVEAVGERLPLGVDDGDTGGVVLADAEGDREVEGVDDADAAAVVEAVLDADSEGLPVVEVDGGGVNVVEAVRVVEGDAAPDLETEDVRDAVLVAVGDREWEPEADVVAVADADAAAEALVDGEGDAAGCEADALLVEEDAPVPEGVRVRVLDGEPGGEAATEVDDGIAGDRLGEGDTAGGVVSEALVDPALLPT